MQIRRALSSSCFGTKDRALFCCAFFLLQEAVWQASRLAGLHHILRKGGEGLMPWSQAGQAGRHRGRPAGRKKEAGGRIQGACGLFLPASQEGQWLQGSQAAWGTPACSSRSLEPALCRGSHRQLQQGAGFGNGWHAGCSLFGKKCDALAGRRPTAFSCAA